MALSGTVLDRREPNKKRAGLNLVSLMDIFTILVFFLLMNSGDSQEIDKVEFIKLPDSQASGEFQNDLLLKVGGNAIMVNDEAIVSLDVVEAANGEVVPELAEFLKAQGEEEGELTEFQEKNGRSVTIMGDKSVPYEILKSVMASCSQENYRDIALAVNQVVGSPMQAQGGQP